MSVSHKSFYVERWWQFNLFAHCLELWNICKYERIWSRFMTNSFLFHLNSPIAPLPTPNGRLTLRRADNSSSACWSTLTPRRLMNESRRVRSRWWPHRKGTNRKRLIMMVSTHHHRRQAVNELHCRLIMSRTVRNVERTRPTDGNRWTKIV